MPARNAAVAVAGGSGTSWYEAAVLLGCALALTRCGTEKVTPPLESGVDGGSDDGALDAEDEPACIVRQCDGSVVYCTPPPLAGWDAAGPPGTACGVGDGCNWCICFRQKDGGVYRGGCSEHVCACPVPDGG